MSLWTPFLVQLSLIGLMAAYVWPLVTHMMDQEAAWERREERRKRSELQELVRKKLRDLPPSSPTRILGEIALALDEFLRGGRKP